jgi:hypothetical protein
VDAPDQRASTPECLAFDGLEVRIRSEKPKPAGAAHGNACDALAGFNDETI